MISFNVPPIIGGEKENLIKVMENKKISGDGEFSKKCELKIEELTGSKKVLMTTSGTSALEMSALLADIKRGDEVIMPSYTFVSTANAFVLRGAKIVFVDIRPDTMNIDETLIEQAITEKTKAIAVVHYAGVSCEMDSICALCKRHNLVLIEDAAQGVNAFYKDKALGSIGDYGCFSFHETKNYSMGEGGALLVNSKEDVRRAEIIREKGTNRTQFFRGEIDKYTWVDVGSSYLQSELNCAYLYAQIKDPSIINDNRITNWNNYYQSLKKLSETEKIELPYIPDDCTHNGHMFYIKTADFTERANLIKHLKNNGIGAVFHYVPLHSSPAGKKFGRFCGEDKYTTKESERLLRLPMYYGLSENDVQYVVEKIYEFYGIGI